MNDIVLLGFRFELCLFLGFCTGLRLDSALGLFMACVSTKSAFRKGFLFELTLKSVIFSKFTIFIIGALMRSLWLVVRTTRHCTDHDESIEVRTDLAVSFCFILPLVVGSGYDDVYVCR